MNKLKIEARSEKTHLGLPRSSFPGAKSANPATRKAFLMKALRRVPMLLLVDPTALSLHIKRKSTSRTPLSGIYYSSVSNVERCVRTFCAQTLRKIEKHRESRSIDRESSPANLLEPPIASCWLHSHFRFSCERTDSGSLLELASSQPAITFLCFTHSHATQYKVTVIHHASQQQPYSHFLPQKVQRGPRGHSRPVANGGAPNDGALTKHQPGAGSGGKPRPPPPTGRD